jgi:hypothetical protein
MTGSAGSRGKRNAERFPILGGLHGEVMVFQPMAIREISPCGAQIETRFPLQLDSLHEFRLGLGTHPVVVKGRIAHCRISDVDQDLVVYCSGVEFVRPSDRVRHAIGEFIDMLKAGRQITGSSSG